MANSVSSSKGRAPHSLSPLHSTMSRAKQKQAETAADTSARKTTAKHPAQKSILPSGFSVKPDGYYYKASGDGGVAYKICGLFTLVAETRSATNDNWGSVFEWADHDGFVHRNALPKALLAGDGSEMRSIFLNRGLDIETSSNARGKFTELVAGLKTDRRALAVDRIGWTNNVFVTPGRTIGDASDQLVIYQGADGLDHPYRTAGTLKDWQDNVARDAIGNSRITVAIAAAFVGPCLALLGEEGGGFHFRGPSSIGKSTALFAAASAWGSEEFVRPWRATANGLEGACVQHNQTLLCLDEIGQLDPREAGTAAYSIGNGRGKARASRSGHLRSSATWTVMFLSSGEISLAELAGRDSRGAKRSGAGQDVRICDIPADAGVGLGLFETLHDADSGDALARRIKAGCRIAHGTAGPAFVERMLPIIDSAVSDLKVTVEAFGASNVPKGADGQVMRVARRFALVAAVGELGTSLGVLPWPKGEATRACAIIFRDWLTSRGGVGSGEDREAISRVRGYLEMHGSARFEAMDAGDDSIRIVNRAGFWRETDNGREYLFLRETWKSEVCAGMDASLVAKVLASHGLLRQDSERKNSISVKLPSGIGKTRCYVVSGRIFEHELST